MAETNYREVYIENQLEMNRFLFEPSQHIKETYKDITKDFASSNLKDQAIDHGEKVMEIITIMVVSAPAWLVKSIAAFERDMNVTLQLNRSRQGFLTKASRSNFSGDITDTKNFEKEKNKTIFGTKS